MMPHIVMFYDYHSTLDEPEVSWTFRTMQEARQHVAKMLRAYRKHGAAEKHRNEYIVMQRSPGGYLRTCGTISIL